MSLHFYDRMNDLVLIVLRLVWRLTHRWRRRQTSRLAAVSSDSLHCSLYRGLLTTLTAGRGIGA